MKKLILFIKNLFVKNVPEQKAQAFYNLKPVQVSQFGAEAFSTEMYQHFSKQFHDDLQALADK